jgi:hypothetical protein
VLSARSLEHRLEIGRDPHHAPGAQRLNPGLLNRLKDRARQGRTRRTPAVHRIVMIAQAQSQAVGGAAQLGGLLGRKVARRVWQAHPRAAHTCRLRPEADSHVVALGNRAQRRCRRPLEDLGRRILLGHQRITSRSR